MSQKIYVSNIPMSVVNETLAEKFAKYGMVYSANILNDHTTNRSTNTAFVEMAFSEDAQIAIESLDGSLLEGLRIFVSEAHKAYFH
jgi:RNA recognition motif-containing protein